MAFETSGRSCPNCGTQLNEFEINEIEEGTVVRCRSCSYIITREGVYPSGVGPGPTTSGTYPPPLQQGSRTQQGGFSPMVIFFIGFAILSIGLYSWIFYIPLFSEFFFGEIIGGIALIIGLRGLWNETSDPSGFWILLGGLAIWILAWLAWFIYIPLLSDFFIGEIGGLVLIFLGYQRLKR
jgi:hypothetical protein